VEFDSRYSIFPNLDFQGSIGYTHATLTDYTDPITGANLDGVTAPYVPEFDAVAALDYHLENGLFARIEYLATGNTKFDDFNRAEFQQNAYGLINAAVGWRNDQRSISVFGTNLGAEEYYTIMNTDIRTGAVGIPRIIGVKAGIQF
jgi:outer membrane receptor for ferric coprogen and ferric-rhodotorulic acid